jgi:arylsulfatase A-like enzyme
VGRIVAKIDSLDLGANTLILFVGDNGTSPAVTSPTRQGPYAGGKGAPKVNGTHVPMLARWLGQTPRGRVCEDLIDTTDFFPSLAQATGAAVPEKVHYDGQSFLAQLQGRPASPREWLFFDYNPRWGNRPPARWVMNKQHKLYSDGRAFDYLSDPQEQTPIQLPAPVQQSFESVLARYPAKASISERP